MATTDQVLVGVLPRAAQVARGFVFGSGRVNLGEQACAQEAGQLPRIAPVRLDPLARLARDQ
jgi:hypothetical protein